MEDQQDGFVEGEQENTLRRADGLFSLFPDERGSWRTMTGEIWPVTLTRIKSLQRESNKSKYHAQDGG